MNCNFHDENEKDNLQQNCNYEKDKSICNKQELLVVQLAHQHDFLLLTLEEEPEDQDKVSDRSEDRDGSEAGSQTSRGGSQTSQTGEGSGEERSNESGSSRGSNRSDSYDFFDCNREEQEFFIFLMIYFIA